MSTPSRIYNNLHCANPILESACAGDLFTCTWTKRVGFSYKGVRATLVSDEGEVISEACVLEYRTDCLEMHVSTVQPGERAIIVDDLVATGGTLSAAIRLLEHVGAEVVKYACVIGMPEVKGQCRLNGKPFYILVEPRQLDNGC